MAHLSSHLLDPVERPEVVDDACALIDAEVARASGLSGLGIRSAYRLLTGIRPGMVANAVDGLLGPFCDRLDPLYQEHLTTGKPLHDVFVDNRTTMADSLLAITDDRAARTSHASLRGAYQRVRGSARRYVEAAAPALADLIAAHAPPEPR